jgi:hypothetical protein
MNKTRLSETVRARLAEARIAYDNPEPDRIFDRDYWQGYIDALDYVDDLLIVLED